MSRRFTRPPVLVLMGVSGSGKSTIGALLAARLGWVRAEGDDLHPAANVAKMAAGQALSDADRAPWLARVRGRIDAQVDAGQPGIITCSALRRAYRDTLRDEHVVFVYLAGTRAQLAGRLGARRGHFMPARLLDSQLAELEPPGEDEQCLRVDIGEPAEAQVERIITELGLAAVP